MKTLNDVINAVQHETKLSRSQLSLKIGKSRNYLNTTVKNGLSYEKEQELIYSLLELVDDEVAMLRSENARISSINIEFNDLIIELSKNISSYKAKLKEVINENLDIVKEKNDEIETLKEDKAKRHRELIDYENKCENTIDNLNETIATKKLFIDGLDMENKGLMGRISKLEKNLNKMCEINKGFTDLHNKKEETIKDLEQKIVILGKEIDNSHAGNKELKNRISKNEEVFLATSNYNDSLRRKLDILDRENQHIKISHLVAIDEEQSCKNKVRFLTASIIGLVAIFSVYLWVK